MLRRKASCVRAHVRRLHAPPLLSFLTPGASRAAQGGQLDTTTVRDALASRVLFLHQPPAFICIAVTHSDYKGLAAPHPLTIIDNKVIIGNEKSSGLPFSRAWVTVLAPSISVLTLAPCVLKPDTSLLALKSDGPVGTLPISPLYLPHVQTHRCTPWQRLLVFVISPTTLTFFPRSICWGWKGFNFQSNCPSLAHNAAAYCSHKEQGRNVCVCWVLNSTCPC